MAGVRQEQVGYGLGCVAVTRYDPTLTGNSHATYYFAMMEALRRCCLGAAKASLALLALAAIIDAHGNAARAMFDAAGPLLTVGAARWIASCYETASA